MTLKKSKFLTNYVAFLILGCSIAVSNAAHSREATSSDLPIIHYAGVLPVQWERDDTWSDLSLVKRTMNKDFSDAVRASHRFVVLNEDLVASLWSSPAGRKELSSDYELQAFVTLNMAGRGDMVVMTARLLSPGFETWLQESEVVPRSWVAESHREQVVARLGDLIHRLINRLPIDAHVTSVSGQFATISAGTEQSLAVGDEFDVIDPKIQTLHPANGSWLSFTTGRTGKVKIVETKGKSSIAKISSLTHESSIAVGQGIRVEAISGRNRFARPDGSETFVNAQSKDGNALIPAMKPDGKPAIDAPLQKQPVKAAEEAAPGPVAEEAPKDDTPGDDAETTPTDEDSSMPSGSDVMGAIAPEGSDLNAYAGLRSWSIGGSGTAGSSLPLWLVNSAGATVRRELSESVVINYGLDLGYGPTAKGSFFAYGIHGSGVYVMKAKVFDGADKVFGGLEANIHSISAGGESSGGFDMTTLSLLAGLGGKTRSKLIGSKLDWTGDLRFALQESGRFGVSGKMAKINSGRGLKLRFQGYLGDRPKDDYQWGAGFIFGSGNYSLAKSKSATYNEISLLGLMRWVL